jgi:hypothetical protein
MKVIMVRPIYDEVTATMSGWGSNAIQELSPSDDLSGEFAIEAKLRSSLENNRTTDLLAFYGHGMPRFLVAHPQVTASSEPLINADHPGIQPAELAGRKLYAVACHAGAELGPLLANSGCTFIGYHTQFAYAKGFEDDFERIVNHGLAKWATNAKTCSEILNQLQEDWRALKKDHSVGSRKSAKDAFLAALAAHWNEAGVCCFA